MQSAALSLSQGFRDAAKHSKAELSDGKSAVCPVHLVTPCPPDQHGEDEAEMHRPSNGRKLPKLNKTEVRDKLAKAFLQAVPSAKHLALETGSSVDTAEGWRSGLYIPGGYNLILLAREFPEVRAVLRQLVDCDFDQDPRAYAMFLEAMRYAQGRAK